MCTYYQRKTGHWQTLPEGRGTVLGKMFRLRATEGPHSLVERFPVLEDVSAKKALKLLLLDLKLWPVPPQKRVSHTADFRNQS